MTVNAINGDGQISDSFVLTVNDIPAPLLVFHHADHLSGASVDTDINGNVLEVIDYYPFGESRIDEKSTVYGNDYTFTGKELDEDTKLYYYEARYYNPKIARFVSQDPWEGDLKDPQSLNKYAYVRNNPLKYVDPTGKCFWDMCFTEGAIIATGINLLGMIAVKILGNELSKTIVPPDDSSNTQSASISQTQSQAQSQSQAKSEEKTEEEYVTVYRGDYSGKNGFLAKGIENGIESVFNEGTLDQQVERHTENSDYSPFVSVTADPNVAKDYATNYEEHNGSIYTLRISKDRLIPVPGSKNGEFLVPLLITRNEIINEEKVTVEEKNEK